MKEVMMMMITSPENSTSEAISQESISNTTSPSWKLYENPFFKSQNHQNHHQQHHYKGYKHIHNIHLPLSARKIAASFWDLTFFRPIMETELDIARAQIIELKAELDYERKARKKVESLNKRLAKELAEERRGREAMERVCEELAGEISSDKEEINRMKKEMDEERKMLRMAEVLREERVQMKLTEAKMLLEEKLFELEETKRTQTDKLPRNLSGNFSRFALEEKSTDDNIDFDSRDSTRLSLGSSEKLYCNIDHVGCVSSMAIQRRRSTEAENPHIKQGIKGFVEFPRVVRAIGSKNRNWGTKLECQKAQLRILLRHRSPIRSNNLILS
ncbi:protein BRANCHLESS TRICHOME-like [Mangifera indica]|uniref:protein BRANCHLESS TRICHOME-like n=1 Tax=Mangifera indica TaxID=29780 RepID=UPI001CF9C340|nr:protein BRANCHLESS TRICHOME-like [Mangifera indica]